MQPYCPTEVYMLAFDMPCMTRLLGVYLQISLIKKTYVLSIES
jgi:hypothetical protein